MTERSTPTKGDWVFQERDIKILQELSGNPTISSRQLAEALDEKYGIEVSHVTISETIRKMRKRGVFCDAIWPNEMYYNFSLFEFKFNPDHNEENRRNAIEDIKADEHTLMFFTTIGEYRWKTIMMFRTRQDGSRWIHEFYKEHGDVVDNVRNSVVHNLLKFRIDPDWFELLDSEE